MAALSGLRRMRSVPGFAVPHARMFSRPAIGRSFGDVFVTGLSKHTTSDGLRAAFEEFGKVVRAEVVTDPVIGYNEGIGFVRYTTVAAASNAFQSMGQGKLLDGWVIFAAAARVRIPKDI